MMNWEHKKLVHDQIILDRGATEFIRYSNIGLRNWTNEEIKRLLHIEYRKPKVKEGSYHE